jgi:site-specific DNA-methyltransferase (adenine-specific)
MISEAYLMDCMEYLRTLPDNFADLALVDPPYGLDLANMNMGIGKGKKASKIQNRKWNPKDWDKNAPTREYFNQLFRISKNQIIWGGNYFELPPCKNYIIWDKEIPLGLSFADCEMAWTSFDCAPKMFRYSAYLDKANKLHPTAKPIKLYSWIYANYLPQGGKVIDTHLGSGSNRIAADKAGNINFYATEIDADYFNAQEKRWREYKAQAVITFPERIDPVQSALF